MESLLPTIFSSLITGLLTWMITKRQSDAQTDETNAKTNSAELKNLAELISIYKTIAEDLKLEVEHLKAQMIIVEKENIALRKEMKLIQKAISEQ